MSISSTAITNLRSSGGLWLALVATLALTPIAWPATPAVVGPEVHRKLLQVERVRVFIYMNPAAVTADASPSGDSAATRTVEPAPWAQAAAGPEEVAALRERIAAARETILARLGADEFILKRQFETIPALAGEINARGLQRLIAIPGITHVNLDVGGTSGLAQAVPLSRLNEVQSLGFTGEGVTVAVLDSGLDTDHADLGDDLEAEACFCSGGGGCCPGSGTSQFGAGAAEDDNGHGSNVTGIVTSKGTVAPLGGAPDARIVAIKVIDRFNGFCCTSDVVAGLDWIIANRFDVDIVNMSLGTFALYSGDCDFVNAFTIAFANAINTLRNRGVTTFVSAGNEGSGTEMPAPACVANALSVGAVWDSNVGSVTILGCTDATTAADQVTCFSNSNGSTDLFAPGAPITSAYLFGATSTFYGTSQASPLAAACAALLLESDPTLTPADIEAVLEATGVPVTDLTNGLSFPRLDCRAAFDALACDDADGDGFGSPGMAGCLGGAATDCNDGDADTYPGAPEICDGVNNDCDHPGWPSTAGTNDADDDGDGLSECQGDCLDTNNQVWAIPGGIIDLVVTKSMSGVELDWNAPLTGGTPAGMRYDVIKTLTGWKLASAACLESDDGTDTHAFDTEVPPLDRVLRYVVRPENDCGVGSAGQTSTGAERRARTCP